MKIAIIGGGNMGQAFAKGLAKVEEFELSVSDPSLEKLETLKGLGISVSDDNQEVISGSDIVIFAVKPQIMQQVVEAIDLEKSQLLISIAAGISSEQAMEWSGLKRVVRVMPNTPALIGEGISGWFAAEAINEVDKQVIQKILAALGDFIEVKDEALIDGVTAVSASGSGYVFYFLEAMQEAAQELGFSKEDAYKLALQAFKGSALLAESSEDDFATLREKVTSKGGTTEAALELMDEAKIKENFKKAIHRANARAEELRS